MFIRFFLMCAVLLSVPAGWSSAAAAKAEDELVTGVDVSELVAGTLGEGTLLAYRHAEARGVGCMLMRGGEYIGSVVIGVFADRKTASAILEQHVFHTSVWPDTDVAGKIGHRAVAWGQGRIVFVRDNAVVDLGLKAAPVQPAAAAMDAILAKGGRGVSRGPRVPVPRISEVKMPATTVGGSEVKVEVHVIVPEGANGDELGIADAGGMYNSNGWSRPSSEIVYTLTHHAPKVDEKRRETFWLCYATAGCVIASKEVSVTVEPK